MIFKKALIAVLMLCFFASCSSQNTMETEDIFIEKISNEEIEETNEETKIEEPVKKKYRKNNSGACNNAGPTAKGIYGAEAYP